MGLFGSVMGLTGLSVAWRLAQGRYGAPAWIAECIAAVAVLVFVLLCLGHAVKFLVAPDAVLAEFRHPITGNMFGTFLISLLLLPLVLAPVSLRLAQAMWWLGTIGMLLFAWYIVSRWLRDPHQRAQVTPARMIPVVGLLDVPLALPVLGLPHTQGLMVLGLAVGLFFAVPLFTLILARLTLEAPMPDALQPTLLILVAPFAVGASAYSATTGQFDLFAQALFLLTLFMLAVLLGRLSHLGRGCPFKVLWWSVSFPLAASTVAALRYAAVEPGWIADTIALMLLACTSLVILFLFGRTVVGVARGELRALSH